ncbi:MAG: nitrate/nitrite transporter NrtS [Acidimicrobiales bacterium]
MTTPTPAPEPQSHLQTWTGWRQAIGIVGWPPHLRRTITTALAVGTVLFAINQLNVVIDGHANTILWIKTAVTYLVPFSVSNIGILIATHRRPEHPPQFQALAAGVGNPPARQRIGPGGGPSPMLKPPPASPAGLERGARLPR